MNTISKLTCISLLGISSAAMAQSSLTLFGVADAGLRSVSADGKSTANLLETGGDQTSRIGFKGSEDLGGGLAASFWLEGGVNMGSGMGYATNTNNQASGATTAGGLVFDRRSTVSLSNSLGEIRLGRDYVPSYWNLSKADPFFRNGVSSNGNLIGAGSVTAATFVRASNAFGYVLPSNLGGVYGQAMYATGNNTNGSNDGQYTGLRIGYAANGLDVAAATGKTRYASGDFTDSNIMAIYDFGKFKVSGVWNASTLNTPTKLTQHDWMLGVVVPVNAHEFKASYTTSSIGGSTAGSGGHQFALGYGYNFSARTYAYAHYSLLKDSGSAAFSNGAAAPVANGSSRGVEVGMRHYF